MTIPWPTNSRNHQMSHVGPFEIIKVNGYPNPRDDQPQIIGAQRRSGRVRRPADLSGPLGDLCDLDAVLDLQILAALSAPFSLQHDWQSINYHVEKAADQQA